MKWSALMPPIAAAMTVAACYSAGSLLLARLGIVLRRFERIPLAFLLGAACMHLALFAIFAMKIAYKPVLLALALGMSAAAVIRHSRRRESGVRERTFLWSENLPAIGYAILFVVFTILYFVNAWAPETSPDGSGYHLAFLAQYLRARGFEQITTNMYAGLGEGAELLYALAFAFGRHSAAALVHFSFAIALAMAMVAYGLRIGKWWVGACAALLVYASPLVGRVATTAYVDIAAGAVVFATFYLLEIWDESSNDRVLIAVGLLCGYAYAVKYTAVIVLLYAFVFVAWRRPSIRIAWKPLLTVGVCAVAMMLPWMIKNWLYLGDPIAPFGVAIFRNPNVHLLTIQEWAADMRRYDLANRWTLPLELTIRGFKVQGLLGPVFLALPLALFALRYREGRRLLLAGFISLIPYAGNIGARFLIPCLPFFALAMTLAIGFAPRAVAALVLVHAVSSWPAVVGTYSDQYAWRLSEFPIAAALRIEPEEEYVARFFGRYPDPFMIDDHVPPGERVLSMSSGSESYSSHVFVSAVGASFNQLLVDALYTGWNDGFRPKVAMVFSFPEHTQRRIRILQTAHGGNGDQWNVHEVRYLRGGVELMRSQTWRIESWPNPWQVGLAFDNSPATRWRSWEIPAPGMFIETDFGDDQTLDQVVVETSPESLDSIKLDIEAMDSGGHWIKIGGAPELRELPVSPWLRRAAAYELLARGIRYMVVHDGDFGAYDYLDDPDIWGFKIIVRHDGVTLYKIEP